MQEELSQIKAKQMEFDEGKKMHTCQVENFEEEIIGLKSRFRHDLKSWWLHHFINYCSMESFEFVIFDVQFWIFLLCGI